MIAALAAPYGALNGWAVIAAIEATLTIAPPPGARRCGSVCLQERNVPPAWTPSIRFQRSSDHSSMGPKSAWPAALKTQSMRPSSATVVSTAARDRLLVGDVDLEPDRPLELGRDRLGLAAVEVEHGDPSALRREPARDGLREARPRSGREEHLSLEPHLGSLLA